MAINLLAPPDRYLPWWRRRFAPLSIGSNRPKLKSGCGLQADGNIGCSPEKMRADAERQLHELGLWEGILPLAAYTLARYASSEVGSSTPEEKAAVIELAINQSRKAGITVNDLLLYRQASGHPNYGWYGPIHGPEGVGTAPYGRWASTKQDPGIDDVLIAGFVLSGKTSGFNRGADDQLGMDSVKSDPVATVKYHAARRDYWVGPVPGVDHWHLFMFSSRPDISPTSPAGQALTARAVAAVSTRVRPSWVGYPIAKVPSKIPVAAFAGLALAAGMGLAYVVATYVEPAWRRHR